MAELLEGTLDRDGATLAYDDRPGSGPAVIAAHGLTSSRAADAAGGVFDWSPVSAGGRRLVRYDARGHGHSTGRPVPADYGWSRLADDLLALLDVVSPNEPVDAIGVSMGAGTILHAIVTRPDRFRRLALVIPPTAWETRAAQSANYRQVASVMREHGVAAVAAAAASLPPLPILDAGGWVLPPSEIDESIAAEVMLGAADADFPSPDAVAGIQQPVLLRPWVGDPGHPVSTAERLHELLPNSTLEVQRTPDDLRGLGARIVDFFS
ncbi:alpha/beta fold hydrolase [Salinibacterium soli]|uniref:Alpha/beta hydrolase n=1 Tax=Antiquaquibacter soli TaxID=3064523 RepID=A0ABT9BMY2_9MICO|nr:alpha/beta hydrolase [Protaetiibacter sp. WY-16]MDO7880780.1 alpha/beta hydrolase [Protaetiibacter sp. WY-16]